MEIKRKNGRYYIKEKDITEELVKLARRIIIRVNIDYKTPIDIAMKNFINSITWHDALLYGEINNEEQLYKDYEIELMIQRNYTKKFFESNKIMQFKDNRAKRRKKNELYG